MARPFETGHRHAVQPLRTRSRALHGVLCLGKGAVVSAFGLVLALACQSDAPVVHSEPPREAPAAPVAATPAAAGSGAATPSAAAPAAPGAEVAAGAVTSNTGTSNAGTSGTVASDAVASGAVASGAVASGSVGLAKYEPASAPVQAAPAGAAGEAKPSADGPAAKAGPGQPVQGATVSEEPFSIWLQSVSPIPAGSAATVEAVLVAKPPYHCNADYPHKFKLAAAPAGITYPETTVKGAKVTAERSVLPIALQAQSAGQAKVSGTLSFSVCNDERCLVEKRDLSLDLEVK